MAKLRNSQNAKPQKYMLYLKIINNYEAIIDKCYLLWMFRQKNWTNFSLFSSWSSMNLEISPPYQYLLSISDITWQWFPSWTASSNHPPSWARYIAAERRRRQGMLDRGEPIDSKSCTRCSQTSHPTWKHFNTRLCIKYSITFNYHAFEKKTETAVKREIRK